jgi:hypothetical protein
MQSAPFAGGGSPVADSVQGAGRARHGGSQRLIEVALAGRAGRPSDPFVARQAHAGGHILCAHGESGTVRWALVAGSGAGRIFEAT